MQTLDIRILRDDLVITTCLTRLKQGIFQFKSNLNNSVPKFQIISVSLKVDITFIKKHNETFCCQTRDLQIENDSKFKESSSLI